ncbi:hypothetical protein GGR52DRAFT_346224 [Hypoxylon sp. FL1284]|nr:hypothetical protein GGR52DRAFT_346224 [Hypoxylon sp. FL1284]
MTLFRALAAASVASLWTLGQSSPMPTFEGMKLFERADGPKACTHSLDGSEKSKRAVWDTNGGEGVGQFLDDWIKKHGDSDWINKMDQDLYSVGASNQWCNSLGGAQCPGPDECSKYDAKNVTQLYWILKAASTHYELSNHINDWLQTKTISDTLAIPDLVKKFGGDVDKNSNIWGIVIGALVSAAGLAAPIAPELSAGLTVGVGAANFGSAFAKDTVDYSKAIADQLNGAFQATVNGLKVNLNLAMTGKDGKSGKKSSDLPNMSGPYSSNIAKYFDGGKFLMGNIEEETQPMLDNMGKYLKQGSVMAILRAQEYFIFVDEKWGDQKSCEEKGTRKWVDNSCAELWQLDHGEPNVMGKGSKDDYVKDMQDSKYGSFDMAKVYSGSIACARSGQSGVDQNKLPTDGSLPQCFYNFAVFKGKKTHKYGTEYLCGPSKSKDDINTTGRRASKICDD